MRIIIISVMLVTTLALVGCKRAPSLVPISNFKGQSPRFTASGNKLYTQITPNQTITYYVHSNQCSFIFYHFRQPPSSEQVTAIQNKYDTDWESKPPGIISKNGLYLQGRPNLTTPNFILVWLSVQDAGNLPKDYSRLINTPNSHKQKLR